MQYDVTQSSKLDKMELTLLFKTMGFDRDLCTIYVEDLLELGGKDTNTGELDFEDFFTAFNTMVEIERHIEAEEKRRQRRRKRRQKKLKQTRRILSSNFEYVHDKSRGSGETGATVRENSLRNRHFHVDDKYRESSRNDDTVGKANRPVLTVNRKEPVRNTDANSSSDDSSDVGSTTNEGDSSGVEEAAEITLASSGEPNEQMTPRTPRTSGVRPSPRNILSPRRNLLRRMTSTVLQPSPRRLSVMSSR